MANLKRIATWAFVAVILTAFFVPVATSQNFFGLVPTDRLLGRDTAGTGQVEPLTVGGAIAFTGSGGITVTGTSILSALTEGTAIDFSGSTISFDSTEVGTTTWGSGSGIVWTFDAGATDPVLTLGSASAAWTGITSFSVGTSTTVTTGALEIAHASANTFTCSAGHCTIEGATIWDSGNDGSGSGLDADTLDTVSSAAFALDADIGTTIQAWDADLDSWAAVIRAAGFDTWVATPSSANLASLVTGETGSGALVFGTSPTITTNLLLADETVDIGTSTVGLNDIHFGLGGIINFDGGDVTITHSANDLAFAGVTGDYSFDDTVGVTGSVTASVDVTATAGDLTSGDDVIVGDDLLIAVNGVVNWGSGDCLLTNTASTLALTGSCVLTTDSTLDLSGVTTATLTASGANLLIEGSIARKVGRTTEVVYAPQWNPTITNGATRNYSELATNDIISDTLQFSTATQQFATFYWVPPNAWNAGTVTFRVRWRSTTGASTETLVMELACVAVSNDDALDAAMGTGQTSTDTWIANGDEHISPESAAITCAGTPAKGDTIQFKLQRNVAGDNVADAFIEAAEIFYTTDAANDS